MTAMVKRRDSAFIQLIYFCRVLRKLALVALDALKLRASRLRRRRGPPWNSTRSAGVTLEAQTVNHPTVQCLRARRIAIAMLKAVHSLPPEVVRTFSEWSPATMRATTFRQRQTGLIVLVAVMSNLQTEDLPAVEWLFPWLFRSSDGRHRD